MTIPPEIRVRAQTFWKAVVADEADFLERLLELLAEHDIRFCLIGGQAVNAYVEALSREEFVVVPFAHSLDLSQPGSALRVQIQKDPRYASFPDRATVRDVLGFPLPVAAGEDILDGKVWAASDPARRPSKRRKDLLDIERLLESFPRLRGRVPADLLRRLE